MRLPVVSNQVLLLKRLLLLIGTVVVLALAPSAAHAADVSVGCPRAPLGPYTYTSMFAALDKLDPSVPNTITVKGICHDEPGLAGPGVQIVGFENLTIQTGPGEEARISENQTSCVSTPVDRANAPALAITDSHGLRLIGLIISGGRGVQINESSVTGFGLTVENSFGNGITVNAGSTLRLSGMLGDFHLPNIIQNNCGTGINVSYGSTLDLNFGSTVQGNGLGLGVQGSANLNATADPSEQIRIQNNRGFGIAASGRVTFAGQVIVENNSVDPSAVFPAGVFVFGGEIHVNSSGLRILNNHGPGIWTLLQSTVRLGNPNPSTPADITISGNTEEGLRLTQMSMGWSFAGSAISGNTGAGVTCDVTSYLFGNVTGISANKCSNTVQDKK